ncbi:MAG: FAD-dependent oxidoreductase [Burkholderiales bacterium]
MAKIAVIGGGVVGLTTAIALAEAHDVTVIAREVGRETNSRFATAVWHVYLIKGEDEIAANDVHLIWAEETLNKLIQLASVPGAGVEIIEGVELFRKPKPSLLPAWMDRAQSTSTNLRFLTPEEVEGFNRLNESVFESDVADLLRQSPVTYGYRLQAPAADMVIYLDWLRCEAERCGVVFEDACIPRLAESPPFFRSRDFEILVNCTGLDAAVFVMDGTFTPYRGEYFFVQADQDTPKSYIGDDDNPLGMSYAIPRFGMVAVGGVAEKCAGVDLNYQPTLKWSEVRARAGLYFGWLLGNGGRMPTTNEAIVGFRPVRKSGVRLEVERISGLKPCVIHNYGHGGSGWSLSWGCADKVLKLVEGLVESERAVGEVKAFSLDRDETPPHGLEIVKRPDLWAFQTYFQPLRDGPFANAVHQANIIADNCGIESHEFFKIAQNEPDLLRFWASQEAVTTNAFSQLLLFCCATIENVHARSQFLPVVTGEHSLKLHGGIAENSHPWLLKRLCRSIGVDEISISPADCTVKFLGHLRDATRNTFRALGALGVGNERMLIPEYSAVMNSFETCFPESKDDFRPFLFSNIHEDRTHSEVLQDLAGKIVARQDDYDSYIAGATEGVAARMTYYDRLVDAYRNQTWRAYFSRSSDGGA